MAILSSPPQTPVEIPRSQPRRKPSLCIGEIVHFATDTLRTNKVRFGLTALGMIIGTASLILVVTIGLTGKQYVLHRFRTSAPT